MNTWYSTKYSSIAKPFFNAPSLDSTAATIVAYEHCDYLQQVNGRLINQINDAETEKSLYKNILNNEYRTHSSQLQQSYAIINEKNDIILYMQQTIDKLKKQYRVLSDDYVLLKNNSIDEKQFFHRQIENIQNKCREKIQSIKEQLQKDYELKMNRRIDQVKCECEDRIKFYKGQIDNLTANSTELAHQLKLLENQYKDMLMKSNLMTQQSINWELRKRDYQAQNNYLRDVAQYETILRDNRDLKGQIDQMRSKLQLMKLQKKEYQKLFGEEKTKYNQLVEAIQFEKNQKQQILKKLENLKSQQADGGASNSEETCVPLVMPADLDLMSEIVALRQFIVEKIVSRFVDFFNKTATTDPKKKSYSFTTFKNSFETLKQTNPENKILLYILSNIQRIIKLYCPAMTYDTEFQTVKDGFVKRTVMQCQSIENATQQLYRILELVYRLRHPINHVQSEISTIEFRMMEVKLIKSLNKAITV